MTAPILIRDRSNRDFLEEFARPGRVGLVGGASLIDRLLVLAQKPVVRAANQVRERAVSSQATPVEAAPHAGGWSHAFLFQGRRADGEHWVIESDLDVHTKHIRLGVQENRAEKYFDDQKYGAMAVLDLGLTPEQAQGVLAHALGLVASRTRYSLRELAGTAWALRHPKWRPRDNPLEREEAFYCSAFVRHVFGRNGIELAEGVAEKNTTPEDIARLALPHKKWLMIRQAPKSRVKQLVKGVKARLRRRKK
jgi:hypothetical protein